MKPKRWPVYIPADKVEWFEHMQKYSMEKYGKHMAPLILDLLQAFERNEVERGKKEVYHAG